MPTACKRHGVAPNLLTPFYYLYILPTHRHSLAPASQIKRWLEWLAAQTDESSALTSN